MPSVKWFLEVCFLTQAGENICKKIPTISMDECLSMWMWIQRMAGIHVEAICVATTSLT